MKLEFVRPAASGLARRLELSPAEEEVIRYGLQVLVYTAADWAAVALAGWLAGALAGALVATVGTSTLRLFSGGAHSRSPLVCCLVGAVVAAGLGRTARELADLPPAAIAAIVGAALVWTAVVVATLAPVDTPAHPVRSAERRRRLRRLSLSALVLLGVASLALLPWRADLALALGGGLWWQGLTLTRAGHRLVAAVDNLAMGKG
ncbi:MAG: accessory gene regulator B family protein [Clostridia bacterium]|nr:accessory gene regulator B family protein [Clostridia bacterium]MDH7573144.1 accessory gene regulator B family protein [Clostridia bacterium]